MFCELITVAKSTWAGFDRTDNFRVYLKVTSVGGLARFGENSCGRSQLI